METDFLSQVILPLSLFIIMLGMGLSLTLTDFSRVLKSPKAAIIGILCQMLLLPIVGYIIVIVMKLPGEIAVGLMILSFCPGGVTSNMYSYLSKGDVALSISLTSIVSLVTPFTIPVFTVVAMNVFLEDQQQFTIPLAKTITQLVVITIVPVVVGMLINKKFPHFSQKSEKIVKVLSIVFLIFILTAITAKNWNNVPQYIAQVGAAALSLNILTLISGYYIAKLTGLTKPEAISIGTEVGLQNGTLALLVSGTILGSSVMTIPAATYSILMFGTGAVFGWAVNLKIGSSTAPNQLDTEQSA